MNIHKASGLIGVATLILAGTAFGQTQVPNDFQAGTPARAAEVNENFDTLEAAIDQNATTITQIPAGPQGNVGPQGIQGEPGNSGPLSLANEAEIAGNTSDILSNEADILNNADAVSDLQMSGGLQVFSQGVSIGRLFDGSPLSQAIYLISDTGYLFLASASGRPNQQYLDKTIYRFSGTGCTGTVYLDPTPAWVGQWGGVYTANFDATVAQWGNYYVPRGASFQVLTSNSMEANIAGGCTNVVNTGDFYIGQPNDESITGVSNIEPPHPYTIGVP